MQVHFEKAQNSKAQNSTGFLSQVLSSITWRSTGVAAIILLLFLFLIPFVQSLPLGYTTLILGSTMQEIEDLLTEHPDFIYTGPGEISFTPQDSIPILEVSGRGFIERGIFQFNEESLYSIILHLDETAFDYFGMYSHLSEKYGEPTYLDPQSSYWQEDSIRMTLERPVTVKYLDLQVLSELREEGRAQESTFNYTRERFLENF